jgi:hypothetical protein
MIMPLTNERVPRINRVGTRPIPQQIQHIQQEILMLHKHSLQA